MPSDSTTVLSMTEDNVSKTKNACCLQQSVVYNVITLAVNSPNIQSAIVLQWIIIYFIFIITV
jgi:hypothetical protein